MRDLQICKDKDEAEVWILGLKALVNGVQLRKPKIDSRSDLPSDITSPVSRTRISSPLTSPYSSVDSLHQVRNVSRIPWLWWENLGFSLVLVRLPMLLRPVECNMPPPKIPIFAKRLDPKLSYFYRIIDLSPCLVSVMRCDSFFFCHDVFIGSFCGNSELLV